MLDTLNIFITDKTGETILSISEPIVAKQPPKALKRLLNEPYLISRLLDDAQMVIDLKKEMFKKPVAKYEWNGK